VARTDRLGSQATDAEENVAESGRMAGADQEAVSLVSWAELRYVGAHSAKVATDGPDVDCAAPLRAFRQAADTFSRGF